MQGQARVYQGGHKFLLNAGDGILAFSLVFPDGPKHFSLWILQRQKNAGGAEGRKLKSKKNNKTNKRADGPRGDNVRARLNRAGAATSFLFQPFPFLDLNPSDCRSVACKRKLMKTPCVVPFYLVFPPSIIFVLFLAADIKVSSWLLSRLGIWWERYCKSRR